MQCKMPAIMKNLKRFITKYGVPSKIIIDQCGRKNSKNHMIKMKQASVKPTPEKVKRIMEGIDRIQDTELRYRLICIIEDYDISFNELLDSDSETTQKARAEILSLYGERVKGLW